MTYSPDDAFSSEIQMGFRDRVDLFTHIEEEIQIAIPVSLATRLREVREVIRVEHNCQDVTISDVLALLVTHAAAEYSMPNTSSDDSLSQEYAQPQTQDPPEIPQEKLSKNTPESPQEEPPELPQKASTPPPQEVYSIPEEETDEEVFIPPELPSVPEAPAVPPPPTLPIPTPTQDLTPPINPIKLSGGVSAENATSSGVGVDGQPMPMPINPPVDGVSPQVAIAN